MTKLIVEVNLDPMQTTPEERETILGEVRDKAEEAVANFFWYRSGRTLDYEIIGKVYEEVKL